MTLIAGITDGRTVWMGADSYCGNGDYALQTKQSKIIRRQLPDGSPILFGVSGEMRPMLLLNNMVLPKHTDGVDPLYYVGVVLINELRSVYDQAGFSTVKDGREQAGDAGLLVGYAGRLVGIWYDYTHLEAANGYMAMGSGMYIALGALAVTEGIPLPRRLEMVLEATSWHSPYVRGPFTIESIGPAGEQKEMDGQATAVLYSSSNHPHSEAEGTQLTVT